MALVARISLSGPELNDPEDFLSDSLGIVFPDDVTNQHGDADHSLIYTSPHLPKPLTLNVADPTKDSDRTLFSHFLWNSSLLLAELVERDTLGIRPEGKPSLGDGADFNVKGLDVMELGAGTALPSMMAGVLGARRVVVTDYPAPVIMAVLKTNVVRNIRAEFSPEGAVTSDVLVEGHGWGELEDDFSKANHHAFDRLFVADCLWMPWQHENLHKSVEHFMKKTAEARAWVVAGFHTGRPKMRGFFEQEALKAVGLEVDHIWESECDGDERPWDPEREDDISVRKRWLTVASLKRTAESLLA